MFSKRLKLGAAVHAALSLLCPGFRVGAYFTFWILKALGPEIKKGLRI